MATYYSGEIRQADNAYIRKTMRKPLLDREHEVNLAKRWRDHDDDRAMHELVMAYARLVVSAASKYRHYGLANGDLIQEGNIGLMQAAKRFDPNRGFRFSTYAAWWIRASIQDHILRNWSFVRTGTTAAHKSLFLSFVACVPVLVRQMAVLYQKKGGRKLRINRGDRNGRCHNGTTLVRC